jgi:predicted nucleic acid-binding protein
MNKFRSRFLLDANVIIGMLNGRIDLLAFLDAFPDSEVYINPVVEIEVLAKSSMTRQEELEARALLASFRRVEIDRPICEIAIQIRRAKELRLPDALIAASAINLNATVLSCDPHLLNYNRSGYTAQTPI